MIDSQQAIVPLSDASIGSNANIQTAAALDELFEPELAHKLLHDLGYRTQPKGMVPESHFDRLVQLVVAEVGAERARRVLDRAGALTARYLLAKSICS